MIEIEISAVSLSPVVLTHLFLGELEDECLLIQVLSSRKLLFQAGTDTERSHWHGEHRQNLFQPKTQQQQLTEAAFIGA